MKIAVIPARGGSKRIPMKNIRLFFGKPSIAYSIEAAIESKLFDHIIVSTDNEVIAEVAQKYGAEIPFLLPPSLSDDFTGTNEVIKHAIQWFTNQGEIINYACCIYATAPFLQMKYLIESYVKLINSNKSFVFSATSYTFPIQRALRISDQLEVSAAFPEKILSRSQDLDEFYHDAGQFYWGTADAFINKINLFSDSSIAILIPRYLVQDIDTEEDWEYAELLYKSLQTRKKELNLC